MDFAEQKWTIPAARMKAKAVARHRVRVSLHFLNKRDPLHEGATGGGDAHGAMDLFPGDYDQRLAPKPVLQGSFASTSRSPLISH